MKFWQLVSIVEKDGHLISQAAMSYAAWHHYDLLLKEFPEAVGAQNRELLDSAVDPDFSVAVLRGVKQNLYQSSDGWLRSYQLNASDEVVSILSAFLEYGADVVEDILEFGSVDLSRVLKTE